MTFDFGTFLATLLGSSVVGTIMQELLSQLKAERNAQKELLQKVWGELAIAYMELPHTKASYSSKRIPLALKAMQVPLIAAKKHKLDLPKPFRESLSALYVESLELYKAWGNKAPEQELMRFNASLSAHYLRAERLKHYYCQSSLRRLSMRLDPKKKKLREALAFRRTVQSDESIPDIPAKDLENSTSTVDVFVDQNAQIQPVAQNRV